MLKVFVSYSRLNQDVVYSLINNVRSLGGYEVWFDQEQTGGQPWWDEILERIRECQLFIIAITDAALDSQAVKLELAYAVANKKNILPVLIGEGVSVNLLPSSLAELQLVDYRGQDSDAVIALVRALRNLPEAQPLPDILPKPPEAPISYLTTLKAQIESTSPLSFEQQSALLLSLKECLSVDSQVVDAVVLLSLLSQRNDLLAKVGREIDLLLSTTNFNDDRFINNITDHETGAGWTQLQLRAKKKASTRNELVGISNNSPTDGLKVIILDVIETMGTWHVELGGKNQLRVFRSHNQLRGEIVYRDGLVVEKFDRDLERLGWKRAGSNYPIQAAKSVLLGISFGLSMLSEDVGSHSYRAAKSWDLTNINVDTERIAYDLLRLIQLLTPIYEQLVASRVT